MSFFMYLLIKCWWIPVFFIYLHSKKQSFETKTNENEAKTTATTILHRIIIDRC